VVQLGGLPSGNRTYLMWMGSIRPVNPGDVGLAMAANSDHGEGFLRSEDAADFNPRETFLQGQELGNFPPLPGVAEIGKVEPIIPRVLKSGKL